MIFRIILYVAIFWLIGRFLTRFVLPLFQMTKVAQDRLKQMKQQMDNMQQQQKTRDNNRSKAVEGEYIDYEEVK